MPNKSKREAQKLQASIPKSDPMPHSLPMPAYDYQTSESASLVLRYDEQQERQEKVAREKAPTLHNLNFSLALVGQT